MVRTPSVAILSGPTGTGKSRIALAFAKRARARGSVIELVNADSVQIYKGFDVGSAKPSRAEQAEVRHHLLDLCSPEESFSAADFVRHVSAALSDIHARGARALLVGGTGFYLKALLYGMWNAPPTNEVFRASVAQETTEALHSKLATLDPEGARATAPTDRYRVIRALEIVTLTQKPLSESQAPDPATVLPYDFRLLALDRDPTLLEVALRERAHEMLARGLLDETRRIWGEFPEARALGSVGYAQTLDYLEGRAPKGRKIKPGEEGLLDEITLATRQLASTQRTWFRGEARAGHFRIPDDESALDAALESIYFTSHET